MRHKGVGKAETRSKILNAVSRGFRKFGFSGIGVDGLAKLAGVTSGAFYAHLGSKSAAFEAALTVGLDEVIAAVPKFQQQHGQDWLHEFCHYYLGKRHRDDLECGCAMASLTTEVVRSDPHIQDIFENKMQQIAGLMAEGLEGGTIEERNERAWAVLSILIGGLNFCRAVKQKKTAEDLSHIFIAYALEAAGKCSDNP